MSPIAAVDHLVTAEELLAHPEWEHCELIDGKVIFMSPANFDHGAYALNIGSELRGYVKAHKSGTVVGLDVGFILRRKPDTVRAPDVMYYSKDRVPAVGAKGFNPLPPDLAVEVVSPTDRNSDVSKKIASYLDAGVSVVWVVYPSSRSAQIHRTGQAVVIVNEDGALTAEDLLPGFSLPLTVVFER